MMSMLFARRLCRNKHVKLSSSDVSVLQLLKQPCSVLKSASKKADTESYCETTDIILSPPPPYFYPQNITKNINKLIMYYQQEKVINNVFPGNLMGSP